MSGPKVVRIVSREEIEAICRRLLKEVDRASAALTNAAHRHGQLNEALGRELESRRTALEGLVRSERWMDLQKQAPAIVAFLKKEAARIEADAIARGAAARAEARHLQDTAYTLAQSLKAAGLPVPSALSEAKTADATTLRQATDAARRALLANISTKTGAEDGLAKRLARGEEATPLQKTGPLVASADRIDTAIAEAEVVIGREATAPFLQRAAALSAEPAGGRRSLLADSLVLEMGRAVAAHRAAAAVRERVELAVGALEAFEDPAAGTTAQELAALASIADDSSMQALARRAEAAVERAQAELAATARRRAVLAGLAELGYEVRQSTTTALASNGRIVVRRPGGGDYGVEVAATATSPRIQVRLVGAERPATPRSRQRDRDAEVSWCGDVARLKALVARSGGSFDIERALEAGAEPVKSVAFDGLPTSTVVEDDMPTALSDRSVR